jgi:hypothetical protein
VTPAERNLLEEHPRLLCMEPEILAYHYRKQALLANLWNGQTSNTDTKAATMKFVQINLNHNKATTAVLCQKLAVGKIGTICIPEP